MTTYCISTTFSIGFNKVLIQQLRNKATSTVSFPGGEKSKWWQGKSKAAPTVTVIRLSGVIADRQRRYINYSNMLPLLDTVVQMKKIDGLALEINSPGGSPAQSDLIRSEIRRIADIKKIPVMSFVEDLAASGGYYLACAGESIHVNAHSMVGSIGAISANFGLDRLIDRWSIERRIITAGKSKVLMDPFSPFHDSERAKLQHLLDAIHQSFISAVKDSRGDRLKEDIGTPIFEGDVFTATDAIKLGLVDTITPSMETYLIDRFGKNVKVVRLKPKLSGLSQLFNTTAIIDELKMSHPDNFESMPLLQRLFIEQAITLERNHPQIFG